MAKVIFNADDFGYCNAVNYGIVDSYRYGILTSTTLMANMPGAEHAAQLAAEHPGLGIGVHLTLTCGRPLKNNVSTLTDEKGNFRKQSFYLREFEIDLDELYEEWDLQIQRVLALGIRPTHLDSHHHAHTFGSNSSVAMDLARKYSLPLRNNDGFLNGRNDIRHTDLFVDDFDQIAFAEENQKTDQDVRDFLEEKYKEIKQCKTVEVMCHPAYMGTEILTGSSFNVQRCKEIDALICSEFAGKIRKSAEIELITYQEI